MRDDARTLAIGLGGATRAGAGWLARCPVSGHGRGRGDCNPSLSLTDGEAGRVLLRCHAGCPQAAVIDALRARGLWGGETADRDHRPAPRPVAPVRDPDQDRLALARRIWRQSILAAWTPVESYLRARGISIPPPPTLRFVGALWHAESGRHWPAMVAAVQGPDGRMSGLHRTFFAADGTGKAPVSPNKKMLGSCTGGAVRLTPAGETLQVCEGIETGLALAESTSQPTWAALSTSGMPSLILPLEVRRVIICADGDDAGEAAAQAAAARWAAEGREVRIARPPRGFDFLDVLAGKVSAAVTGSPDFAISAGTTAKVAKPAKVAVSAGGGGTMAGASAKKLVRHGVLSAEPFMAEPPRALMRELPPQRGFPSRRSAAYCSRRQKQSRRSRRHPSR